jgi:hypothetical protein
MVEKQCQGKIKDEPWPSDQVIQIINTTMGIVVSCDQSGKRARATHSAVDANIQHDARIQPRM